MKKFIFLSVFVLFALVSCNKQSTNAIDDNLQWSEKAPNSMSWEEAVSYCGMLTEGGHNDWKLPDIDELRTLIQNHSGTQTGGTCKISQKTCKLADKDWNADDCSVRKGNNFSKLADTEWLWSSSVRSDDNSLIWFINFFNGKLDCHRGDYDNYVRCVRVKTPSQNTDGKSSAKLTNNTDPLIIGNLQWSWSQSASNSVLNRDQAITYCKNLTEDNHNDWELPNIDELRTLIQNHPGTQTDGACKISEKTRKLAGSDKTDDCYNTLCGNNMLNKLGGGALLWSSSVQSDNLDYTWVVDFSIGGIFPFYGIKGEIHYDILDTEFPSVRCVRKIDKKALQPQDNQEPQAKEEIRPVEAQQTTEAAQPEKVEQIEKTIIVEGLHWSYKAPNRMNWNDAVNYCKNLNEGGRNDWRLPNVDELRTIIKVPETITGGKCPISEKAGTFSHKDFFDNEKVCYLADNDLPINKLGDMDGSFWSSSAIPDSPGKVWSVGSRILMTNNDILIDVHCVAATNSNKMTNSKDIAISYNPNTALHWSKISPNPITNWNDAMKYCENLDEDGLKNWRLPNIDELRTLIKAPETITGGKCQISEKAGKLSSKDWSEKDCEFPATTFTESGDVMKNIFWSSSVISGSSTKVWSVDFGYLSMTDDLMVYHKKDTTHYVRCVLDSSPNRNKSKNPIKIGKLQWSEPSSELSWNKAIKYCENLNEGGYSDWRLPTINELRTLIQNCANTVTGGKCRVEDPRCLISTCYDKDCKCSQEDLNVKHSKYSKLGDKDSFWSSSTLSAFPQAAWVVNFLSGSLVIGSKNFGNYARCTRNAEK